MKLLRTLSSKISLSILSTALLSALVLAACGGSADVASGEPGETGNVSAQIDGEKWKGTALFAVDYDYQDVEDAVAIIAKNYGNSDEITLVFKQKKPSSGSYEPDVFTGHAFMLERGGRVFTSDDAKSDAMIAITRANDKKGVSGKFAGTVYAGDATHTVSAGKFKNVPISK